MKRVALLVGVENYHDPLIAPLTYAGADVAALEERLTGRCGFDEVTVLAEHGGHAAPDLHEVLRALDNAVAELEEDDLFLFYFSGHGIERDGRAYLLTRDSTHARPQLGSLSRDVLQDALRNARARRRILLFDACRNAPEQGRGAVDNLMPGAVSRDMIAAAQTAPGSGATTALLSACKEGTRAFEWAKWGHGVFTHFLLDGLDGAAWEGDRLDFKDLASHTIRQVRAFTERAPGIQRVQEPWYQEFGNADRILLGVGKTRERISRPAPPAAECSPQISALSPAKYDRNVLGLSDSAIAVIRSFVERHNGTWNHRQWLELLQEIRELQGCAELPDHAIGAALEKTRRLWLAFRVRFLSTSLYELEDGVVWAGDRSYYMFLVYYRLTSQPNLGVETEYCRAEIDSFSFRGPFDQHDCTLDLIVVTPEHVRQCVAEVHLFNPSVIELCIQLPFIPKEEGIEIQVAQVSAYREDDGHWESLYESYYNGQKELSPDAFTAFQKEFPENFRFESFNLDCRNLRNAHALDTEITLGSYRKWREVLERGDRTVNQTRYFEILPSGINVSSNRSEVEPTPKKGDTLSLELGLGAVLDLVYCAPGKFKMGGNTDDSMKPAHDVSIVRGFWLGIAPVTIAQWKAVMVSEPRIIVGDDRPHWHLSWSDCQEFISRLNAKTAYGGFRLPSEAEWEYACRAGSSDTYSFGEDTRDLSRHVWYQENSNDKVHPVCQLLPNAWGLYDMGGNVQEWCMDYYHDSYEGAPRDGRAWTTPMPESEEWEETKYLRVIRGSQYNYDASGCLPANRTSQ